MLAYILRRLLLVIPTLFGIMVVNFALTQFVPGGPFDQIEAQLDNQNDAMGTLAGGNGDDAGIKAANGKDGTYTGARGLPPEFIAQLEVEFGFSRIVCDEGFTGPPSLKDPACHKETIPAWKRFFIMLGNYVRLDFGDSYFRSTSVVGLILEKMPVSITLGLWSTLMPGSASSSVHFSGGGAPAAAASFSPGTPQSSARAKWSPIAPKPAMPTVKSCAMGASVQ